MKTIREAAEDIFEAAMCLHFGNDCHPFKEAWGDLEDSTRALARLVLEESHRVLVSDDESVNALIDVAREVNASIEEIGK